MSKIEMGMHNREALELILQKGACIGLQVFRGDEIVGLVQSIDLETGMMTRKDMGDMEWSLDNYNEAPEITEPFTQIVATVSFQLGVTDSPFRNAKIVGFESLKKDKEPGT